MVDKASMYFENTQTLARLNRVENGSNLSLEDDRKLREACKDFEAILVKQMLDSMRRTIHRGSLVEKNQGEDIFEDMLYQEYAEKMADTESLGVSQMMYRQLALQQKGDLY